MSPIQHLQQAFSEVEMVEGLAPEVVRERLHLSLQVGDIGRRQAAFWLAEMKANEHYRLDGYDTIYDWADANLRIGDRRTRELVRVGTRLPELPHVERCFLKGVLSFSQLTQLCRIATPQTEEEWIEISKLTTVRELKEEIAGRKLGDRPRDKRSARAIKEALVTFRFRVDHTTEEMLHLMMKKLSDERGEAVTLDELIEHLLGLFANLKPDGSVKGYKRVRLSRYQLHTYPASDAPGAPLLIRTKHGWSRLSGTEDDGLIASQRDTCARCDGQVVQEHDEHEEGCSCHADKKIDDPTPEDLRIRALKRDNERCRCCGRQDDLHVHHIQFKRKGGRTLLWNLVTVCVRCHSLLHKGWLEIRSKNPAADTIYQDKVMFTDRAGNRVHYPKGDAGRARAQKQLLRIQAPAYRSRRKAVVVDLKEAAAAAATKKTKHERIPLVIERCWWRQRKDRIRASGKGLELRPGAVDQEAGKPTPRPDPVSREEAFGGLVGHDERIGSLVATSKGARKRGKAHPHTLFQGPPGVGKTTLAKGVAKCFGARVVTLNGPSVPDVSSLVLHLANLEEDGVLFIDEIHAVPQGVLEELYQAMTDRELSVTFRQGGTESVTTLALPRFTLIAATTEPESLPEALRSRFGQIEDLEALSEDAVTLLVRGRGEAEETQVAEDAAEALAFLSRGRPREALRMLEVLLNQAVGRDVTRIDLPFVEANLDRLGFDEDGLKPQERRMVEAVEVAEAEGKGLSLKRAAGMLGLEERQVLRDLEPTLCRLGFLKVDGRGRRLGWRKRKGHFKPFGARRTCAGRRAVSEDRRG